MLDSPNPSKTQSTVGTVLSINTATRQPGRPGLGLGPVDLASPTRGRILAAFTAACLQTHLALCFRNKSLDISRTLTSEGAHVWLIIDVLVVPSLAYADYSLLKAAAAAAPARLSTQIKTIFHVKFSSGTILMHCI
jgi:hypothetical protein